MRQRGDNSRLRLKCLFPAVSPRPWKKCLTLPLYNGRPTGPTYSYTIGLGYRTWHTEEDEVIRSSCLSCRDGMD